MILVTTFIDHEDGGAQNRGKENKSHLRCSVDSRSNWKGLGRVLGGQILSTISSLVRHERRGKSTSKSRSVKTKLDLKEQAVKGTTRGDPRMRVSGTESQKTVTGLTVTKHSNVLSVRP